MGIGAGWGRGLWHSSCIRCFTGVGNSTHVCHMSDLTSPCSSPSPPPLILLLPLYLPLHLSVSLSPSPSMPRPFPGTLTISNTYNSAYTCIPTYFKAFQGIKSLLTYYTAWRDSSTLPCILYGDRTYFFSSFHGFISNKESLRIILSWPNLSQNMCQRQTHRNSGVYIPSWCQLVNCPLLPPMEKREAWSTFMLWRTTIFQE